MAPAEAPSGGDGVSAVAESIEDVEVRLTFDIEQGGNPGRGGGSGGGEADGNNDDDEEDDRERPPVTPLRLPENGEIDEVATRMLHNISGDEAATKLGRSVAQDDGGGSVEVPPGPTGLTVQVDEATLRGGERTKGGSSSPSPGAIDHVAETMMAKIRESASSTQLGRMNSGAVNDGGRGKYQMDATTYETQNYDPGYQDTLSPRDRKVLESELRHLRISRMEIERVKEDDVCRPEGGGDEMGPAAAGGTAASSNRSSRVSFPSEDVDVREENTNSHSSASAAQQPAPVKKSLVRSASRSAASFMGMGNFFKDQDVSSRGGTGRSTPENSSRNGSRRASRVDGNERETTPPIRIRRTSSYYVKEKTSSKTGGGGDGSSSGNANGGPDGGEFDGEVTEDMIKKRKIELIKFRMRAAAFVKLSVTLLSGLMAGFTLWAMTTFTAELTGIKFNSVRKIIRDGNLVGAWALYAFWAAAAVGITAFGVLHPRGFPMARGSGIAELKGYLNGNRQRGLFHWRTFVGRAVGICLVIVATMPFGREGPSIHIGACVASMALNLPWRSYVGWMPSPEERRQILQLGSAAGVAAAFNAPIGGLLYVMEEVASSLPPDYVWRAMITTGTAVGLAQVLYAAVAAQDSRIDYSSLVISDPNSSVGWVMRELPLVVVLAVLAGCLSAAYTLCVDYFGRLRRGKIENAPKFLKTFLASKTGMWIDAVAGAVLVASLQVLLPALFECRAVPMTAEDHKTNPTGRRHLLSSGIYVPRKFVQYTCGPGRFSEMGTLMLQNEEGVIKHLFARDELYTEKLFTPPVVFCFLAYFFFVAVVTFGGAYPAGVFVPNMLIGAALGRLFGFFAEILVPEANKGTYALIGAAAQLGGFTRMTAAVTVIMIEATGVLDVLAPIILACVVARATANALIGHNLDERMIHSKGVPFLEHEAHPTSATTKIGDALKEAQSIRGPIIAFRPQERMKVLLNALLLTEHNAFPVLEDVEQNTGLKGLVTRAMLQRVLRIVLEKTKEDEIKRRRSIELSDPGENSPPRSPEKVRRVNSFTRRVSATITTVAELFTHGHGHDNEHKADGSSSKNSHIVIDDWAVEGLEDQSFHDGGEASKPAREMEKELDQSNGGGISLSPPDNHAAAGSLRRNSLEFMHSVAKWMHSSTADGGHSLKGKDKDKFDDRHHHHESIRERVVSAAQRHAAKPTIAHADDANHFDELKEELLKEIRLGTRHVSNEHLARMVDLSHALDPAPWTVDRNAKVARVHALFSRLGVRHLCVVSDNGGKFEGIITRHDLIHVHRLAEEH